MTCSRTCLAADACRHAWPANFKCFSIDSCLNDVQPGKLEKTLASAENSLHASQKRLWVSLRMMTREDRRKKILLNTNRTFRPHGLPQQKIKSFFSGLFWSPMMVSLRCRQRSQRPSRSSSLSALGRKGVADFPPLACTRNRKWTDSPFLQSLRSTTALFVRRSQDENRVLDLVFARKRTDWQLNGRSWAVLWMIDVLKKLPIKKIK